MKSNELKSYLLENYSKKSKEEILNDLDLSWNYIQKKCCLFGIKRQYNESSHSHSLKKLLDFDNVSCYWLGFLLADGHLSNTENFQVNLSKKDESHFLKIESHLENKISKYYNNDLDCVRFTLSDRPTILALKAIFNWSTNKTKNIPVIPDLNSEQLFSLIIGFIDGDGSIKKSGELAIKCDLSWKEILEDFHYHLTGELKSFNESSCGCSLIYVRFSTMREIKKKAMELNLPFMCRKWDRIDINRILKNEKYDIVLNEIKNGLNHSEIKDKYGFGNTIIYRAMNEINR